MSDSNKKVVLEGAISPEKWGWDENPKNGVEYNLSDIPKMYGPDFYDLWTDEFHFIGDWQDIEWNPEHGKWREIGND